MTDGSQSVDNNKKSAYNVLVDKTAANLERQLVGIDIGTVTANVLTPSRVSASNPLPVTGVVTSGTVTANQGTPRTPSGPAWGMTEYSSPSGFPNYYWELFGILGVPTAVVADPITATPWDLTGGFGKIQGSAAHAGTNNANPVKIGFRAQTAPTGVSNGAIVDAWGDLKGRNVVVPYSPTATLSNVSGSASSVTLLAANTARSGAIIVNDSTAILYVKYGATASATSYTVPMAGTGGGIPAYHEVPFGYPGIIDGIWASATGAARITELS